MIRLLQCIILQIALFYPLCLQCWNKWDYSVQWSEDPAKRANTQLQWEEIWVKGYNYKGNANPPRPRRGHSLHLIKSDVNSDLQGHTYLIMFGGRDNDQLAEHKPITYNVQTQPDGTLVFTTYDEKPVSPCNDPDNKYYDPSEQVGCNFTTAGEVNIALIYNDVWAYKLCNATSSPVPERYFDTPCEESGWILLHAGAHEGGCLIQLGILVCTVPSERFNHASTLFDDGTLYVYGGLSLRCEDYCDDLWFFDIYLKSWRQVYAAKALTSFHYDTLYGVTVPQNPINVPVSENTKITDDTLKYAGPGKRWRHTMAMAKIVVLPDSALTKEMALYQIVDFNLINKQQSVAIFGGHRIWHGYAQENSVNNDWNEYTTFPHGGYLNDLWIYTKYLDFITTPGSTFKQGYGVWTIKEPVEQCFSNKTDEWSTRFDRQCIIVRPIGRAGHGSAYDSDRNRIWIFGGYTTYFPYLSTDGPGAGDGVTSGTAGTGFIPYPGYQYFLNDLWYYDLDTSLWIEIIPVNLANDSPVPDPRMDAMFLLLGDVIFVHGGFADNNIYGDTWYFNISLNLWLQKTDFVKPLYPDTCTDDFEYIHSNNSGCIELLWPKHLEREQYYPFDIIPYGMGQTHYWPDYTNGPYYGIFSKNTSQHTLESLKYGSFAEVGTPIFPFAATGVMQYAKKFHYMLNSTHNATLYQYCTSTVAEPTRGMVLDGKYGRANFSILIPQPRPRKPGWDGCRDRFDHRKDLPQGLQWLKPSPRYSHRGVFHEPTKEILFYGGMAYDNEEPYTLSYTYRSQALSDMWYYNLNHCPNNCTGNGECFYGFCSCHVGYYGIDCSNISCPGTFCYYNDLTHQQNCTHACQAGYIHTDNDTYVQDIYKIPCTVDNWGESNGICNGFGTVQCAPPFVGDDCGTKDCKSNCSFNGWCSIEYPVSRCLCVPGYFGDICEYKLCLNNCSFPNGECNITSGTCNCNLMYSPYNNTRVYKRWNGEDCSYLYAYSSAFIINYSYCHTLIIWILIIFLTIHFAKSYHINDDINIIHKHELHSRNIIRSNLSKVDFNVKENIELFYSC